MGQRGGRRGTNPLTVLPLSPRSPQLPASRHSLSFSIPTPHLLLHMNDSLLQCLPVLASRTTVPNGTTSLSRRSSQPCRRTNNPTSQTGMDIPSHRHPVETTTIATVPPRSMGGAVSGRPLTMTTRNTTLGRLDAYATASSYPSSSKLTTAYPTEWSTEEPSTGVSYATSFRLGHR